MGELPTEYDAIVIGTGMTGSIIAAALSRIGKTVLHIDENDFYGEDWASFNLETIDAWLTSAWHLQEAPSEVPADEDFIRAMRLNYCNNVDQKWHVDDAASNNAKSDSGDINLSQEDSVSQNQWTKRKIKEEYRKFNLDLSPRVLYSRGSMVELLISSNIARYTEFKNLTRVLTWRNNQLENVPCSRADVFATKNISVVQKRMLVKVLTLLINFSPDSDEFKEFEDKTFAEFLHQKKLDEQLIHYIVHAIAMCKETTPCFEAITSCQCFLKSLGRYGNTPFICPLYGAGEIPQCFCRLCAVFGGVYHLNRKVDGFITNDGLVSGIRTGGQILKATHFAVCSSLCPAKFLTSSENSIVSRGIFITDKSIAECEKEPVTLLRFPPSDKFAEAVTVIEMGSACHVCPQGLFVVHMTAEGSLGAQAIQSGQSALWGDHIPVDKKPKLLWSLTWNTSPGIMKTNTHCPKNLKVFSGPDANIDYDGTINEARLIFEEMLPGEEFLPRAPDPEEIVLDGVEPENDESQNNVDLSDITSNLDLQDAQTADSQ